LAKRAGMALPSTGCAAGLAKPVHKRSTATQPLGQAEIQFGVQWPKKERAGANPGPSSGWLGWLGILLTNQLVY
jgi:hypothetical protein